MGRGKQAGSPISFRCWRDRREYINLGVVKRFHTVNLTGRTKPYRGRSGCALGQRSTRTSREYICACGHVGWSNHMDLRDKAARDV